ncbi:MAG: FG-GAP-like repeat-containing protein [Janthinobacterium lividum]
MNFFRPVYFIFPLYAFLLLPLRSPFGKSAAGTRPPYQWLPALLLALPLATWAQAPTVVRASLAPAANAAASLSTAVVVPFSQPINPATAGNIRVFSARYRGLRTAYPIVSGNNVTLALGLGGTVFLPGETVQVSVPATVQGTNGAAATKHVYQFTTATSSGTGTFAGGSDPAVGSLPFNVALGDVDGDGDLDLVTANASSSTVSVRLNNGAGTFGGGTDVAVGSGPVSVALGDVDGDGDLDLVTANNKASGTARVRLNNGAGTFAGGTDPAVGSSPGKITLGDVDGDGDLDLLTVGWGGLVK